MTDSRDASRLPLDGIRILDMTAWWAGPAATHMLACLGAEVIHVESISRPDGMRMIGGMMAAHYPQWWEASQFFLAANNNKKDVTLDLTTEAGRELVEKLVRECDAVVENFTPRVLENFGLTWERIQELNPRALFVRMPAFGLSGPWRDNTGFAQTMEQLSGLAWLTGHPDDQPRIPRGPCDPLAGMHATHALLVALAEREATGRGHLVECTMVEGALNVAAEQLVEFTAYGNRMEREGNRSPIAAPQGLYACAGSQPGQERWLALSISTDAQWRALCGLLGDPDWAAEARFETHLGRRAAQDEIDVHLRRWAAGAERSELVEELLAAGISAAPVADPRVLSKTNPQLESRGFFERLDASRRGTAADSGATLSLRERRPPGSERPRPPSGSTIARSSAVFWGCRTPRSKSSSRRRSSGRSLKVSEGTHSRVPSFISSITHHLSQRERSARA